MTGRDDNIIRSSEQKFSVVENLYQRLKDAPAFRYAAAGFEIGPFYTFTELTRSKGDYHEECRGLVLSREVWEQMDRLGNFIQFSKDYYWIPYRNVDFRE